MTTLRSIIAAALVAIVATAALGLAAIAEPTKTRLIIVNGHAGKKIDFCVNGNEKRSGLRYGGKTVQLVGLGPKKLKFYQSNPRKCGGKLLAKRSLPALLDPGDLTIVLTKRFPGKVQVFDNRLLNAETPPADGQLFWRDAADIGNVALKYEFVTRMPVNPAASPDPVWQKGDELNDTIDGTFELKLIATRPGKTRRLAKTPFRKYRVGQHREAILVGDTVKNARFVELVVGARAEAIP